MRIPAFAKFHINSFAGGSITELESGITNGIIEQDNDDIYLTQRPSIDVFEDASAQGADGRGRAIHYWDETSALYILNNGTLYKSSQSNSISTSPTAGTAKCRFLELGTTLILLDAANDQGFTISNADSVAEITDTDFPPKQTPAIPLAHGGAVLDKYLFVLGTNGVIYNSALSDASTWGALDFKEAERENDGGVYLGKHHDHIVVYGVSTIEFFYDAANTAGSPLNKRTDVSFNIGCSDGQSVWEEGDRSFFVGVNYSGALGIYGLESFQVRKLSTSTIDSFITQAIVKDGYTAIGSGFTAQGHTFYILTLYTTPSDISPEITLVYDDTTGYWSEWDLTINSLTKYPLVGWTKRLGSTERYGEGILANGDLITVNDDLQPNDTLLASTYVATDYVLTGYVTESGATGTSIVLKSRTGAHTGGTNEYKYPSHMRHAAELTDSTQTLTIRWADEKNTFNTGKTTDTSKYQKITRIGRFRRRNHELEYSGDEPIRIEAIEIV